VGRWSSLPWMGKTWTRLSRLRTRIIGSAVLQMEGSDGKKGQL
jgi:hypothetical protein